MRECCKVWFTESIQSVHCVAGLIVVSWETNVEQPPVPNRWGDESALRILSSASFERRKHISMKVCSHLMDERRKKFWQICDGVLILSFIILVIVLLIWAILQPKKPDFVLQDTTIYAFNVTAPNFLTSTILVTIASRNPNDKINIYYDKLDVFAIYQNQQITYYTAIPPTYQWHKEVNVWSPMVSGVNVPVAPYNGVALSQDQADGTVMLTIKIEGRVRFKVGTYISGRYHLYVKCPANIVFGNPTASIVVGNGIKYQLAQSCSISL